MIGLLVLCRSRTRLGRARVNLDMGSLHQETSPAVEARFQYTLPAAKPFLARGAVVQVWQQKEQSMHKDSLGNVQLSASVQLRQAKEDKCLTTIS